MSKSNDTPKKSGKTAPAKTPKEKKADKAMKKQNKQNSGKIII